MISKLQLPMIISPAGISLPCRVLRVNVTNPGEGSGYSEVTMEDGERLTEPYMRVRISAQWASIDGEEGDEKSSVASYEFLIAPPKVAVMDAGAAVLMIPETPIINEDVISLGGVATVCEQTPLPRMDISELFELFGGELMFAKHDPGQKGTLVTVRLSESCDTMFQELSRTTTANFTLLVRLALKLLYSVTAEDMTNSPFHISIEELRHVLGGKMLTDDSQRSQNAVGRTVRIPGDELAELEALMGSFKMKRSVVIRLATHLMQEVLDVP